MFLNGEALERKKHVSTWCHSSWFDFKRLHIIYTTPDGEKDSADRCADENIKTNAKSMY